MVPLLLNTYYPPNVPTAARCHDIGRALRRVLDADTSDLRVAIVASGGLSHFVVDEELDRRVMRALPCRELGPEGVALAGEARDVAPQRARSVRRLERR